MQHNLVVLEERTVTDQLVGLSERSRVKLHVGVSTRFDLQWLVRKTIECRSLIERGRHEANHRVQSSEFLLNRQATRQTPHTNWSEIVRGEPQNIGGRHTV